VEVDRLNQSLKVENLNKLDEQNEGKPKVLKIKKA
jgi:hypothetical protein